MPISVAGWSQELAALQLCIRNVGHVSHLAHRLEAGDEVGVRGAFGTGFPVTDWNGRNILLIAGGLGIAPLRSLLHFLLRNRASYLDITLMYGARQPALLLFRDELTELSCGNEFRLLLTVDFLNDELPQGLVCRTGLVTELLHGTKFPTGNTVAAVCGPPALHRCVVGELEKAGIKGSDIFLSLERRMKCGTGICCHCAIDDLFCCTDGPVFRYEQIRHLREEL